MTMRSGLSGTLLCIALLLAGCSSPSGPTDQSPTGASAPAPEPAATQPVAPAPQPETATEAAAPPPEAQATTPTPVQESKVATPSPRPAPSAMSSAQAKSTAAAPVVSPATGPAPAKSSLAAATAPALAPAPAPAAREPAVPAATPDIVDPGGTVAVAATKPGLRRIGSDACGECHEVQYDSWAKGPHAARTPPLDCESCHGAGSEYKTMSVMKDPAKARAAGLVTPDKAFCSQCHKKGVTDDLMRRAHAHEE